jgi:hypothetical protein
MIGEKARLLYQRLHIAALEYIQGGQSQEVVAANHHLARSTFCRYLRKNHFKLTPEQLTELRSRAASQAKATLAKNNHVPGRSCSPDCTCKRHAGRHQPRTQSNPVILGRRFCSDCKHWRLVIDFHARERDIEGNAIAWQSICATCQRMRSRHTQGIRRRGKPYEQRHDRPSPEQIRARRRERYRERMKNPEWAEQRREYERIYQEARRRANGVPRDEVRIARRDIGPDTQILAQPFALWMDKRVDDVYAGSWKDLATACDVDPRSLYRYRTDGDAQETVISGFVDKCLLNEGSTFMWQLYPHLFYMDNQGLSLVE